jgi:hypothetical protein
MHHDDAALVVHFDAAIRLKGQQLNSRPRRRTLRSTRRHTVRAVAVGVSGTSLLDAVGV